MRHQNQCRAPHEKQYALPSSIQLSVLEDCSGYCSVGYDKYLSLDTERVTATVLQAVSLRVAIVTAKKMLAKTRSLIKTESSSLRTDSCSK